jgi:hypothetical protein
MKIQQEISVADITRLYGLERDDVKTMRRAIEIEALLESWKGYFRHQLEKQTDHYPRMTRISRIIDVAASLVVLGLKLRLLAVASSKTLDSRIGCYNKTQKSGHVDLRWSQPARSMPAR